MGIFLGFRIAIIGFLSLIGYQVASAMPCNIYWEKNLTVRQVDHQAYNVMMAPCNKININIASKEQLVTLQGVGPKKAEAIVNHRIQHGPFTKVEDLSKVKGLSQRILNNIVSKNPGRLVVKDE